MHRLQLLKTKRNKGQTFTSTLTARSKAACGLTKKPKDQIVDIDSADINNELAVVEYVEDMYKFYKLVEENMHTNVLSPEIVTSLRQVNEKIVQISLTNSIYWNAHTFALTESGKLFAFGAGEKGQLGVELGADLYCL